MASKKINIKVFTAFSGYDSQCMGLERLKENFDFFDYELVGWAEIDKPAIASHNAVFPEAADKNYGDISKVDWSKVPDFDLFTYSSPCFVKGTLVGTKRGLIPIEDVVVGDEVLTHTKTWHKVTETMVRKYSGELLHIKGMCINEIICTPEHPFYIREKDRIKNISTGDYNKILKEEPLWKNAKDLTVNDFLCYVINNDSELPKWDGIEKSHIVYDENCIWYPICSIEKETVSDINVYNLEVEEDHSYNVYYTVVHNCQDFSICGTQKGGLSGTGTRSSLLWECQRTIEQKRPKFLLLENVKALYEDHIFRPLLYAWKDTVDSYGYKSWIKVLNSDDYDIPQGRERVFMVSIRTDAGEPDYFWPKEMQRTRTINDFLKWETPEEYYLDDKKFSKFYDLLTNAGAWFNDTTTEHKHLVDGKERVIKRRRYTIKEEDEKEENKSGLF